MKNDLITVLTIIMLEPRIKTVGTKNCSSPNVPKRNGSITEPAPSDNEFLIPGNIINDIIINKRNSIGSIADPIPAGCALPPGLASTMTLGLILIE